MCRFGRRFSPHFSTETARNTTATSAEPALRVFSGSGRSGPGGGQCGPMRGAQMGPTRISEALACPKPEGKPWENDRKKPKKWMVDHGKSDTKMDDD